MTMGIGSFRPSADANPFLGKAGSADAEQVEEARLEAVCSGEDVLKKAVEAMKELVKAPFLFSLLSSPIFFFCFLELNPSLLKKLQCFNCI